MKQLACFFGLLLALFSFLVFQSCDKNSPFKTIKGDFLMINGDTRELVNETNDTNLYITKRVVLVIPGGHIWGSIDPLSDTICFISLQIIDPNNSLIANFGNYDHSPRINLQFYLPREIKQGTYTTKSINPPELSEFKSYSIFYNQGNFISDAFADSEQKLSIEKTNTSYVLEFEDLVYTPDSSSILQGQLTIGGRITVDSKK